MGSACIVHIGGMIVVEGPLRVSDFGQVTKAAEDAWPGEEAVIALGFAESLARGTAAGLGYAPQQPPMMVLCRASDMDRCRARLRELAQQLHRAEPVRAWWCGPDTGASSAWMVSLLAPRTLKRQPPSLPRDGADVARCAQALRDCFPGEDPTELRRRLEAADSRWARFGDQLFGEVTRG